MEMQQQSYTVTFSNRPTVSRDHNMRNPKIVNKEPHIDPNGTFEVWHDEHPRDAYERIFGDAIKEYNNRQKRKDRKIDDYYSKIKRSKEQHPVYEVYVTIGNKNSHPDIEHSKEILKDFLENWKKRNPGLEVIGAYFHADEPGAPHLHIDYVPVKKNPNPKRGMRLQVGADAAFRALGFKYNHSSDTPQVQWETRERLHLEKLCVNRGWSVLHPDQDSKVHLEKDQYIQVKEHQKTIAAILKFMMDIVPENLKPLEVIEEKKNFFRKHEPKKAVFEYDKIMPILERIPQYDAVLEVAALLDSAADRMMRADASIESNLYSVIDLADHAALAHKERLEQLQKKSAALQKELKVSELKNSSLLYKIQQKELDIDKLQRFIADHGLAHEYHLQKHHANVHGIKHGRKSEEYER